MSSARLSPAQIRVANANRWFSTHRFPESRDVNGRLLHQRTDFRVKLKEKVNPSADKATEIYRSTDASGTIKKNPIVNGQIATVENFEEVTQESKGLFASLIAQGLFDSEGLVPDSVYKPEVLNRLDPKVAGVMRLIKGNAYFLNFDILLGAARAENPIDLFGVVDGLVGGHFKQSNPDTASAMWPGRLRYGLLLTILSGEKAIAQPEALICSMNKWFADRDNWLYADSPNSSRIYHSFRLGISEGISKPSFLPVSEDRIGEAVVQNHRIAVPGSYLSDPAKFLDWTGKLIASIHKPCEKTGVVGKFWNHSAQVDLFLHVLRNADFIESPVLLDK